MLKKVKVSLVMALITCSGLAREKVVYGEDNRIFYSQEKNENLKHLANGTLVQINWSKLTKSADGKTYTLQNKKLRDFVPLCEGEKFEDEYSLGNCSGFLLKNDILVTAGHCVPSEIQCSTFAWVSNYKAAAVNKTGTIKAEDVYSCNSILSQQLDAYTRNDYGVVKLDRKVKGGTVLNYRKEGKVELFDPLVIIGYPSGLPLTIADGAFVRNNTNDYFFQATTDSFGGNSGSAVFNTNTLEVEGILVRGERDYLYSYEKGCYEVYQCDEDKCRGEDITRITSIPALAKILK